MGMTADISKMFHEVLLHQLEWDLHRFILRDKAGSLFLATQVLHTLSKLYDSFFPVASQAILNDFYVDGYLAGADTVQEANDLRFVNS